MHHCAILTAPWREPLEVLAAFADEPYAVGLLSAGEHPDARWSYVARKPQAVLRIDPQDTADAFEALRAFAGTPGPCKGTEPPFQGGIIGLAAYELGARAEPVDLARSEGWPDLVCGRYASLLAFDHNGRSVLAIGRGRDPEAARNAAQVARSWLDEAAPATSPPSSLSVSFLSHDGPAYERAVAEVTEAIERGDFFQANIARRWRGRLASGATPFDVAARLAQASPAPFSAYLRLDDRAVVSNSPERFVRVVVDPEGRRVETRPIKGTASRGADAQADTANADALARSPKDRAENLMIVDLMRNDLARVSVAGGVQVNELFRVETFANVHHLVSTVSGRLAGDMDAADLLRATFPPGSVTGAPKVQAMKTIAAMEAPRGPYCGAMFWLGFDGCFDSSVLIRTIACTLDAEGWAIEARAGAGIVADSDPAAERHETDAKIAAIAEALR